jgi:histidine triad (HIT) family protein
MNRDPDCTFCRIVAGEIPCFKLYEDEATLAFMDINPVHPGHALAIPKAHEADVFEVSEPAIAAVSATARKLARAVHEVVAPDGLNLVQCNGKAAAQSVPHFHMHVLPRKAGDDLALNWGLEPGDMDEIGALAERIRTALENAD